MLPLSAGLQVALHVPQADDGLSSGLPSDHAAEDDWLGVRACQIDALPRIGDVDSAVFTNYFCTWLKTTRTIVNYGYR